MSASKNVARVVVAPWLCALLVAASGCAEKVGDGGGARKAKATGAAVVTACSGAQTCTATDAHAKHQASGIDCTACHPCGGKFGFRVGYALPGGTTIQATDSYTPRTPTSPPSCTVACHYPMGSPTATVAWNAATPLECVGCHNAQTLVARFPNHPLVTASTTRAQCETCHVVADQHTSGTLVLQGHPAAWMNQGDPGFHALAANRGLAACQTCHRQDLSGGATNHACTECHRAGGIANDFATCTGCHGGKDNLTGAPPNALWGFGGDPQRGGGTADPVRVGAHTAHVTAGEFGPAFACETCHVKPASMLSPNHIDTVAAGSDPTATVTFGGLAVNGGGPPSWTRSTATCASTYCHGATLGVSPGAIKNPTWTGGSGQVFCGSCHGVPPISPHVSVDTSQGYGVCNPCHSFTVDGAGHIIPASEGGKHLNGLLEASGHDAAWMEPTSATFHAFAANRGIANCTPCHGADLSGGSVHTACTECHRAGGRANDFATCTACHGGQLDQTGAPPAAIWGYAGDPNRGGGTADPIRVGAHAKHLAPTLSAAFDCGVCHVKPGAILSPGHIDNPTPVASLTFGGRALPPVVSPALPAPSWTRSSATCASTYCHGNYQGTFSYSVWDWGSDSAVIVEAPYVGKNSTPVWTGGPMTCASCHGNPPGGTGYWHSGHHGNLQGFNDCQLCHPDATSVNGVGTTITNPALHINGIVEVTPKWGSKCMGCH